MKVISFENYIHKKYDIPSSKYPAVITHKIKPTLILGEDSVCPMVAALSTACSYIASGHSVFFWLTYLDKNNAPLIIKKLFPAAKTNSEFISRAIKNKKLTILCGAGIDVPTIFEKSGLLYPEDFEDFGYSSLLPKSDSNIVDELFGNFEDDEDSDFDDFDDDEYSELDTYNTLSVIQSYATYDVIIVLEPNTLETIYGVNEVAEYAYNLWELTKKKIIVTYASKDAKNYTEALGKEVRRTVKENKLKMPSSKIVRAFNPYDNMLNVIGDMYLCIDNAKDRMGNNTAVVRLHDSYERGKIFSYNISSLNLLSEEAVNGL